MSTEEKKVEKKSNAELIELMEQCSYEHDSIKNEIEEKINKLKNVEKRYAEYAKEALNRIRRK